MYSANLATAQRNGYGFEHGSAYSESVIVKSKDLEEQVRETNSENRHLVSIDVATTSSCFALWKHSV